MSLDSFWDAVDAQLEELKTAKTADDVLRILAHERDPYHALSGEHVREGQSAETGFFAGGGGDETPYGSLSEAGWSVIWMEAEYYWAMRAPDGSIITYVEGDIFKGDQKPLPHGEPS